MLTESRYEKWLKSKFKHITPSIAQDFVRFIDNPVLAIDRLKKEHHDKTPNFTPQSDKLEFSTALAVQVVAKYPSSAAKSLSQ